MEGGLFFFFLCFFHPSQPFLITLCCDSLTSSYYRYKPPGVCVELCEDEVFLVDHKLLFFPFLAFITG